MTEAENTAASIRLVEKLKIERRDGITTPFRALSGKRIAEAYALKFQITVTDIDVRRWVSIARCSGEPIGSNDKGYYWCINETEWNEVREQLRHRVKRQQAAIDGPTQRFAEERRPELSLKNSEGYGHLQKHFDVKDAV